MLFSNIKKGRSFHVATNQKAQFIFILASICIPCASSSAQAQEGWLDNLFSTLFQTSTEIHTQGGGAGGGGPSVPDPHFGAVVFGPVISPTGVGSGGHPSVPDPHFGVVVFGPVIVPQGGGAGGGNPSVPDPN